MKDARSKAHFENLGKTAFLVLGGPKSHVHSRRDQVGKFTFGKIFQLFKSFWAFLDFGQAVPQNSGLKLTKSNSH